MTFLNFKGGHIPLTQIFTPVGRKNFSYAGTLCKMSLAPLALLHNVLRLRHCMLVSLRDTSHNSGYAKRPSEPTARPVASHEPQHVKRNIT